MKITAWGFALCLACCSTVCSAACTVTATSHAFPDYAPLSGSAADTSSSITVECTGLLDLAVEVRLSTGSSGSYAPRKMYKGTDMLNYNLYVDSGRTTTIWGDGSSGTSTVSYVLVPLILDRRTDTVYGRVPASQTTAVPGYYSDTITVTVEYL